MAVDSSPAFAGVMASARIAMSTSAPPLDLELADHFGSSVAFVGDVDGDGITDLAVGAPFDDSGGPDRGAVWLLFLRADGTVRDGHRLSALTPALMGEIGDWDLFGSALAAPGDLDGDGVPDLVVGAPRSDAGGYDRGAVWILHLNGSGAVASVRRIDSSDLTVGGGLDDADRFGEALAVVGDLDGDGGVDLAAVASGDDDGATNAGAVWILRLAADGSLAGTTKISNFSPGLAAAFGPGELVNSGLAAPGDLDADGTADLVIGAGAADRVHVAYLDATGAALGHATVELLPGDVSAGDRFGQSVAAGTDLDGDGIGDLVVGATGDDDGSTDAGAIWIVLMHADATVRARHKLSALRGGLPEAPGYGDKLGAGIAIRPGASGSTLIVGAAGDDDGALNAGALRVLHLDDVWIDSPSTTVPTTSTTIVLTFPSTSSTLGSTTSSTWPPTTSTLLPTTTTIPLPEAVCGDASSDGKLTATDALGALRAAVGLASCPLCICDTDAGGAITVVDALSILAVTTAQGTHLLLCTPCL